MKKVTQSDKKWGSEYSSYKVNNKIRPTGGERHPRGEAGNQISPVGRILVFTLYKLYSLPLFYHFMLLLYQPKLWTSVGI